ncbi:MAG TPA: response regulator, partial [Bacteroidia bacterium]|nr:response regulator [Bacteroidia bacterium]
NPVEGLKYFENEYISLKKEHPTVLFLDLNMPEMSGWEWLEKYNNFPDNVKEKIAIYILSSSVNPSDIDQAHSNRLVKNYVIKPLTKAKIIELIEEQKPSSIIELKAG